MSNIPTSTHLVESTVIAAPLTTVWGLVKLAQFDRWYSALESSKSAKDLTSEEVQCFDWIYKDGSKIQIKQEGHSCRCSLILYNLTSLIFREARCWSREVVLTNFIAIDHFIQYSIISAEPALPYSVRDLTPRSFDKLFSRSTLFSASSRSGSRRSAID